MKTFITVCSNGSIYTMILLTLLILSVITSDSGNVHAQTTAGSKHNNEEECITAMDGTCTKTTNANVGTSSSQQNNNMECGLYMAESSIPHSGFGMYTAITINEYDKVFSGDVVIHTEDPIGDQMSKYRSQYKRQQQQQQQKEQNTSTQTRVQTNKNIDTWLLYSYYWQANMALGEYETDDVQSILPGLGMLANSHTGLINTYLKYPTIYNLYDRYNVNHVGIGSSTTYHNVHSIATPRGYSSTKTTSTTSSTTGTTTSTGNTTSTSTTSTTSTDSNHSPTKFIPAGSELFVQYGDSWFNGRKEKLGIIPLSNDFYKADIVLLNFYQNIYIPVLELHDTNSTSSTDSTTSTGNNRNKLIIGTFRKRHTKYELINDFYEILLHTVSLKQSLYNAFPKTVHDVNTALVNIGINNETILNELYNEIKNDIITFKSNYVPKQDVEDYKQKYQLTASYSVPNRIRSIEWLQQYGRCLDNIYPNRSTIEHAGMGAFATRSITNNSIVTTIPLVHLSKTLFDLYKESASSNNNRIELQGQQLLLNYVYGHRDSTLVLFPYSPISNYINHNSDPNKVNVKIIWSSLKQNKYNQWILENKTVYDIVQKEQYSGLIFDLIAIKNIQPNEELFLDYGYQWQQQWEHHVQNYKPITIIQNNTSTSTTSTGTNKFKYKYKYIPASILNKQYNTYDQFVPLVTLPELRQQQQQQSSITIAPLYGLYDDTNDDSSAILSDVFLACYVTNIYPMVQQTKKYNSQQQKQKKMGYNNDGNNNNDNNNKPKFTWQVPTSKQYTTKTNNNSHDAMGPRYPCDLLQRYNKTITTTTGSATNNNNNVTITHYYYTVEVLYYDEDDDDDDSSTNLVTRITIEHIPQNAIQFVDKQYKSDLSLRNTFRHEIQIPDTIFPLQWKDLLLEDM